MRRKGLLKRFCAFFKRLKWSLKSLIPEIVHVRVDLGGKS